MHIGDRFIVTHAAPSVRGVTSRRTLFGSAAALSVVGASPGVAHSAIAQPDAELIAACAAFDACDMENQDIWNRRELDDETSVKLSEPLMHRMRELLDIMDEQHATTADGILAHARTLAIHGGQGG